MTTLTSALNMTFAGLRNTEARISTTSSNVTNADVEGYTRKTYQNELFTSNSGSFPINGEIVSSILNPFLQEQLISDKALAAENETLHRFMSQYADRLGTPSGENTLNAAMDDFAAALDELYSTPEDTGLKFQVVSTAERLAKDLNDLSRTVQGLREETDSEIAQTVDRINNTVRRIDDLNKAISLAGSTGVSTADLEDQRRTQIAKLSEDIDVQYFYNDQNQVQLYAAGQPVLTGAVRQIDYTANNLVDSSVTYPGGFSAINLAGTDITTSVKGGNLAALVQMRDSFFVEEQDKLNELATVLEREVNTISNQGSSFPGPAVMTGDEDTTALPGIGGATGIVRIATADQNGNITSVSSFDVSTFGTTAGMVAAINADPALDVTASINADNQLVLTADNAGDGIAINDNEMSPGGTDMDGFGTGFSHFFGLNNVFHIDTLGAEDIQVSETLLTDSNTLPTGRLESGALAVGDAGIFPGDGSIADAMNDALTGTTSFSAAGNFGAQNNTLDSYTDLVMSDLANRTSSARADADVSTLAADQTQDTLYNLQGVNIDEEMTYLVDLEQKYQAAASALGTIRDLLQELINAVR